MTPVPASYVASYQSLFDTLVVNPDKVADVEVIARRINNNVQRYKEVERVVHVPWYFTAVVHLMEASLSFSRHLHNGDPLTARTVRVPAGRPAAGHPPFSWEVSAIDALRLKELDKWTDWSIPGILYRLEAYNGFGYRTHLINSPYLWAYSQHYTKGKFTGDHQFNPEKVSNQAGAAVILHKLLLPAK